MDARWAALAVLTTARLTFGFQAQSIVAVGSGFSSDFNLSYADVGFIFGLYSLPGIALAMPGAMVGKYLGDKRTVCAALILSTTGAALIGCADSYSLLVAGRLMSGVGGILLNVIMAKMVMDWFAGKELVFAMAVYMNANPIGVGLAVAVLGPIAQASGWRSALFVTSGLSAICLALMALAYNPHVNDRAGPEKKKGSGLTLSRSELALIALTSAIYTLYNASYVLILVFAPPFLTGRGSTLEEIGLLLAVFNWIAVAGIFLGGAISQKRGHARLLVFASNGIYLFALVALTRFDPIIPTIAMGLSAGLPTGALIALPAKVLSEQSRSFGMGVFYTLYYIWMVALPPLAGWLQDWLQAKDTALLFSAFLLALLLVLFAIFEVVTARRPATSS